MFGERFLHWITRGRCFATPELPPCHTRIADHSDARAKEQGIDPPRPGRKAYEQRHAETSRMTTQQIEAMIAEREAQGKETGVLHRVLGERQAASTPSGLSHRQLADQSDAYAKAHNIDPPRPGRKTYATRYAESSGQSSSDIRSQIAARRAQGKQVGVLERVLADRGED